MYTLSNNSSLKGGEYKILSVLGQGGFGITYLAEQVMLERKVALKEFFMKEYCGRDETNHMTIGTDGSRDTVNRFRAKFLKEARNIARLNHPGIVHIFDVFEENGTAYYVMEYAVGGSLAQKLKQTGYFSETLAKRYIIQVAKALDYIHQKRMNHLDVKPGNIMLNENGDAILIDFGLSKQYDAMTGRQTSTTPVGISDGYAPMEQYKPGGVGEFSPETDIYALGATFFKLLTGLTPPSASDVNEDGVPVNELKDKGVSQKAIDVICKAMQGRKKERLKSARTFIDLLEADTPPAPATKQPEVEDNEATLAIVVETPQNGNQHADPTVPNPHDEGIASQTEVEDPDYAEEMAEAEKEFAKAMENQKAWERNEHEQEKKETEQEVKEISTLQLLKNVLAALLAIVLITVIVNGIIESTRSRNEAIYEYTADSAAYEEAAVDTMGWSAEPEEDGPYPEGEY